MTMAATKKSIAGAQVRALRKELGWSQKLLAEKGGDTFTADEVSKVERGANKLTGAELRSNMAAAFGMDLGDFIDFIAGKIDARAAKDICHAATDKQENSENLKAALAFHRDRWRGPTVAAARAIVLKTDTDLTPQEWTQVLDEIEKALKPIVGRLA